jgi:DNA-binding MarR family transcriptional regulator
MSDLTTAEYQALARFRYALRVFVRFSEEAARRTGLTPNQHQLLLAVRGFPGDAPTISDLAEWLQLRHNSTVELVDRAVEVGLLSRQTDSHDRRRQRLELTPRGAELLRSLSAAHREELRRFHSELAELLHGLG